MHRAIALVLLSGCPAGESVDATIAAGAVAEPIEAGVLGSTVAVVTPPPERDDRPDWVRRGNVCEGRVCFGVGKAAGIRNASLAQATADNRARAEIGRLLSKSTSFALNLSGVEIVDHHVDAKGTIYSLARYERP
jgi:hypothetical protein